MTFDDHIAAGLATIRLEAGRSVTLRRGGDVLTVTAVPGSTRTRLITQNGSQVEVSTRDYLIAVDDYEFGFPRPGDEITDLGRKYVVAKLDGALPCWEWSGLSQVQLRIHTTEVGPA